jgi:transposase-like protein
MDETIKATGFGLLYCPLCHERDAMLSVDLNDLAEFECKDCGETFTKSDMEDQIELLKDSLAKWGRVLAWIDSAPAAD